MGLFDFFKSKKIGPNVKDLVWMDSPDKLLGALKLYEEHRDAVFVAWFLHTEAEFARLFSAKFSMPPQIKIANQVSASSVLDKTVIFLEHYPLRSKEESLMADWKPKEVFVMNSADDPLFKQFGGDKIQMMMHQLGVKSGEMLQHVMINKALKNAQHKLEKKVTAEMMADSAEEWFRKNSHE
jgi:hypothetical protein